MIARPIRPRDATITSKIMTAVRSKNTEPEWTLRRALFRLGLRFRIHYRKLPGRPDLAFPRQRVAVFVDGDFWHGGGWKERGFPSMEAQFGRRADFWITKIRSNVERDRRVNGELAALGWRVIRLWESEVRKKLEECVGRVHREVMRGGAS
jgi:DNA mismatch endonuclease (patch repair protein)